MESYNAIIEEKDDNVSLSIEFGASTVTIPLSTDNSNQVRAAFSDLLNKLQNGLFEIQLSASRADLYHDIATEYLSQLNQELREIHSEMGENDLINTEQGDGDLNEGFPDTGTD